MFKKIQDAIWFIKTSRGFANKTTLEILLHHSDKIHNFVRLQAEWRKLTPTQREAWYLSGEGRTIEY